MMEGSAENLAMFANLFLESISESKPWNGNFSIQSIKNDIVITYNNANKVIISISGEKAKIKHSIPMAHTDWYSYLMDFIRYLNKYDCYPDGLTFHYSYDNGIQSLSDVELNKKLNKSRVLTYEDLIDLSRQYYSKGGDSVYECWDKRTYDESVKMDGDMTVERALKIFKLYYDVDQDRRGWN